jgi:LIVCS family branched-chain amino acid:cation transporter
MTKTKEIFIIGFALFSMFFGAGNLILPPFLGVQAGENWSIVTLGFFVTAVIIPIIGIMAHARLQGTMFDFGKKVSPSFSFIYCLIVYAISIALPAPRTASVAHEMAIAPFLGTSSLWTSLIYFILVFIFVMNRSRILNLIGKYLTPFIIIILFAVIFTGITTTPETINLTTFDTPFISGLLEGYQTFDAIGAIVVGGVLVISMNFNKNTSFALKKELITKAGIVAGVGLLVIYAGLIYSGVQYSASFAKEATRTDILSSLSTQTLGNVGTTFLSVLVALACFTTAVGIITGTADYVKGLFKNSRKAYLITASVSCVLGVLIGQFDVHYIIVIALPALMFIYPITIVLIVLNVLPEKFASPTVFKAVVGVTFFFSIPDFLKFIINPESLTGIQRYIPFSQFSLGWVLPAIVVFILVTAFKNFRTKSS